MFRDPQANFFAKKYFRMRPFNRSLHCKLTSILNFDKSLAAPQTLPLLGQDNVLSFRGVLWLP